MTSGIADLVYAEEKFTAAVRVMATTHGTLQERLLAAWRSQGSRAVPIGRQGQNKLPMSEELTQRLIALDARLSGGAVADTDADAGGDEDPGAYEVTVLGLSDDEVEELADELFDIYVEVLEELDAKRDA